MTREPGDLPSIRSWSRAGCLGVGSIRILHPGDPCPRGVARVAFSDKEIRGLAMDVGAPTDVATIYVCITCRGPDGLVRDPLPGALLAAAAAQAAKGTGITVRPIRCLANCSRGPSAAMRANGS